MEGFKSYKESILELDTGKRQVLIIKSGHPGEQFILYSEGLGTGIVKVQRKNKGELKETYTKEITELFNDKESGFKQRKVL